MEEDNFNDLLSSEEILGGGDDHQSSNPKRSKPKSSGKQSNAKDLEDLHQKAIEKSDDGFEDLVNRLEEQIEFLHNKLRGGNAEIRKPKLPVKVFLRFHMEEYNLVKMRRPEWTPAQITVSLKKRWICMSEAQKDKYIQSYEKDIEKYDKLMMHFNRLTSKPKKPVTPYFQFFQEYLPIYRNNYPQLGQNEITKMIGRDWSNFDLKKKSQLNQEYERQKTNYAKQVKLHEGHQNDYTKFNDYISKVEDYEKELEEELENLRSKHPKAPTVHEIKRQQKKEQDEEAKKLRQEKRELERLSKHGKLRSKQDKVLEKAQNAPTFTKGLPFNNTPKASEHLKIKKVVTAPVKAEPIKKVVNNTQFDIESVLKEARNSNRQSSRLRSQSKEEEPQLRKQVKKEEPRRTASQSQSQSRQPRKQEEKKKPAAAAPSTQIQILTRSQRIKEAQDAAAASKNQRKSSNSRTKKEEKKVKATRSSSSSSNSTNNNSKNNNNSKRRAAEVKADEFEGMSMTRSKKKQETPQIIKYMLGMRNNGDETEYLVLFEDGKQRWTNEDDSIFKHGKNGSKLVFFLRQLKDKQK